MMMKVAFSLATLCAPILATPVPMQPNRDVDTLGTRSTLGHRDVNALGH